MAIEEKQSAECLVLRRGADFLFNRQMGQVGVDFGFGHLRRMALVMEKDKPLDPMAIGLLGSSAVMAGTEGFAQTVEELRFCGGHGRMARVPSKLGRRELDGVNLWHRLPCSGRKKRRLAFIFRECQGPFLRPAMVGHECRFLIKNQFWLSGCL